MIDFKPSILGQVDCWGKPSKSGPGGWLIIFPFFRLPCDGMVMMLMVMLMVMAMLMVTMLMMIIR